ncbi:ferredoxin [Desulfurispira natronophila]|uniref:Ferredoxin n=1 Tax=Desulfurispira natronophila TaxID=682562 RepID=A0A7W7Y2G5_9BACT|nr:ferredoxin [Desulfurispira natronophila]MBB5020809.1 ferredoxin [Desulfurispira natronophila]
MARKVIVDQESCIACGMCYDLVPEVFSALEDGMAQVHDSQGASEEQIQEAIDACPVACIHWEE